ncbi:hypothetical protein RUM44_010048 [Polyplax serrata]|uniref:Uncharacterized protein n=1 Tax=Polyplax serrata TaxID=468196 RepID=A0ABR1AUF4_POLSC
MFRSTLFSVCLRIRKINVDEKKDHHVEWLTQGCPRTPAPVSMIANPATPSAEQSLRTGAMRRTVVVEMGATHLAGPVPSDLRVNSVDDEPDSCI